MIQHHCLEPPFISAFCSRFSNYSFLRHPLVIKFAEAEKTKETVSGLSEINWAAMMETISWRLTHSVTPSLRSITCVSSGIMFCLIFHKTARSVSYIHYFYLSLNSTWVSSILSISISSHHPEYAGIACPDLSFLNKYRMLLIIWMIGQDADNSQN